MRLSRIPSRAMRPRACGRMVDTKVCAWAVSFVIRESREPPGSALTVDEESRVSLLSMRTRRRSWKRCPVSAVMRCEATPTAVLATAAPAARRPGRRTSAVEGFWVKLSMMRWSISGETVLSPAWAATRIAAMMTEGVEARNARPHDEASTRRAEVRPEGRAAECAMTEAPPCTRVGLTARGRRTGRRSSLRRRRGRRRRRLQPYEARRSARSRGLPT